MDTPLFVEKFMAFTVSTGIFLQIGIIAGEDFIKENRGLTLDLRNSAHIQTTENFANGKIASHNSSIDYQERYDNWQSNFVRDEHSNINYEIGRASCRERV